MSSKLPVQNAGELKGHVGAVTAVRFNVDGNYCLSCGKDRMIRLWNHQKKLQLSIYKGHSFEVADATASSDNAFIASASSDRQCFIWDVETADPIRKFRGHSGRVNCVKYNTEQTCVITGSYDSNVKIWDIRSNDRNSLQTLDEAKDSITSLDVTETEILTGSVDGHVRCYDIRAGRLKVDALSDPVTSCRFSHDRNCILVSSLDGFVRLFDKDSGDILAQYSGHKNKELRVESCLSYDDAVAISGSEDGQLYFWDLVSGKVLQSRRAHDRVVSSIDYHPKKTLMITSSTDGTIKLWNRDGVE